MDPRAERRRHRFRDPSTRLYDVAREDIHVTCPRCGHRAVSAPRPTEATSVLSLPRHLTCLHCAYRASWSPGVSNWGGPVDPFFGTPLWLQTACCGHTLWAFNPTHLDLVEHFVEATLRERGVPSDGLTLVARLPAWLTSAKNRAEVLRAIGRLRASLEASQY